MQKQKVISRETGVEDQQYKWGFEFDIESDIAPKGLSKDIVRFISNKKNAVSYTHLTLPTIYSV